QTDAVGCPTSTAALPSSQVYSAFPHLIAPPGYALARFREIPDGIRFPILTEHYSGRLKHPMMQAAHHRESDHDKAQYAWNYRGCRFIGCDARLTSLVAKQTGTIRRQR